MRRRGPILLSLLAAALILYGSLMPFRPDTSEPHLRAKTRWFFQQWPLGPGHVSRMDIISNVALYVPLGLLLAIAMRPRRNSMRIGAILAASLIGLGVSGVVEYFQLFLKLRVSSPADLLMNTIGTALGAALGVTVGPRLFRALTDYLRNTWRADPFVMIGGLLSCLLVADALFPLLPTLDVGEVLRSLRRSTFDPPAGWQIHAWHHWLVRRFLPWGAAAALLACSRQDRAPARALRVAVWVILLAGACELGKVFIHTRVANITNVLVTLPAALLGGAVGRGLLPRLPLRAVLAAASVALLGYLAYIAWAPFNFRISEALIEKKWPTGTQWLPLYHYAMGARPEDVRLFLRTVTLMAGMVYGIIAVGGRRPVGPGPIVLGGAIALAFGTMLEAGQFALPTRIPSTTDVFCALLGGVLGGWLWCRWPLGQSRQRQAEQDTGLPPCSE